MSALFCSNEVPNAKQDIKKQKRETVCPIRYIKEGLDVSYTNLFEQTEADYFLKKLETGVKYYSGTLSRVKVDNLFLFYFKENFPFPNRNRIACETEA